MQKISSFLQYSRFEGLMNYMATSIFDHAYHKIIETTFSSPEFATTRRKSVHSINSFLKCNLRVPWPDWPRPFLIMLTQNFWSTFSVCELLSKWKKSGYFTDLFCRYGWLKNPAIWLAEEILGHSSGKKTFFPNMGFVREHNT